MNSEQKRRNAHENENICRNRSRSVSRQYAVVMPTPPSAPTPDRVAAFLIPSRIEPAKALVKRATSWRHECGV